MNSKDPGIHFLFFVFDFKVISKGTCWYGETEALPGPPLDIVYQTCHQVKEHLNYVVPTVHITKHFIFNPSVYSGLKDPFVLMIFLMGYTPQCINT